MTLRHTGFFNQLANLGDLYQPGSDTAAGTVADVQNTITSLDKTFRRSATPPTWPATSAASKAASANSPPAHRRSPPACIHSPTATSKCCQA